MASAQPLEARNEPPETAAPQVWAWPEVHDVVVRLLDARPRGRVLDMPCGPGALTRRLIDLGFAVEPCDIEPENFAVPGHVAHQGDLAKRFPFPDAHFDYAVFVEGPEHVANVLSAFEEFARVLKPAGKLIVTLPHYTSIERRLRFLVNGTHEPVYSREEVRERFGTSTALMHISPMTLAHVYQLLQLAGFDLVAVHRDKFKRKQFLLLPLALLVMGLARLGRSARKYLPDPGNSFNVLLGGNTLVLIAEKKQAVRPGAADGE